MADELLLQLPRDRVVERGYGTTHLPRDVETRLSGEFAIDPLTGYATARVLPGTADPYDWNTFLVAGIGWVDCEPFVVPGGTFGAAVAHRSSAAWTLTTLNRVPAAEDRILGFICYGDQSPFTMWWGPYALQFDEGEVIWYRSNVELARAQLWGAEEWTTAAHFLYLYAIGGRLAIRRLGQPRHDLDPGLLIETGYDNAAGALPEGFVTMTGTGYLTFALAPAKHETTLSIEHETINLPEESTQTPTLSADTLKPAGTDLDVAMVGPDGEAWAEVPDPPYTGAGYRVTAELASETGPNVYVTRVRLAFPELAESDEAEPVDLATFDAPGIGGTSPIESIELRRGPDPGSCGLTLNLLNVKGEVAPYIQPHMKGRWSPDGEAWLTFYTSRPELVPELNLDLLRIDCESDWKRFKHRRWSGDGSYSGMRLAEAYRDVALKAGMAADEIEIYSGGYDLPTEQPDDWPLFDFLPGQTLDTILMYLNEQFGEGDRLLFKADGKLYAEARPTEATADLVFSWETPADEIADIAAGVSDYPRIHDWREGFTEDGLANDVWVVGQHRSGQPLVAVATDWESVREQEARNYTAGFRQLTIVDAGLTTQGLVNWVARQVLERVRWPRLTAWLLGTAVADLYEGDIIEVEDKDLWRITSMQVTWSDETPTAGLTSYELEYYGEAPEE